MKKRSAAILSVILALCTVSAFAMSSCGVSSLEDRGMKVIETMTELAENYEIMGFPASFSEYLCAVKATDYTTPDNIYEIIFSDSFFNRYTKDFPDSLKEYYSDKASITALQTAIIGHGSNAADAVAFSSATSASYVCVDSSLKESTTYIYTFEGGYPVAVSLIKGENGAISVVGRFIPVTDIKDADDIREFFTQADAIEIEDIKQIK